MTVALIASIETPTNGPILATSAKLATATCTLCFTPALCGNSSSKLPLKFFFVEGTSAPHCKPSTNGSIICWLPMAACALHVQLTARYY